MNKNNGTKEQSRKKQVWYILLNSLFVFLLCAAEASAYIGPGAGFAFVSTFFIFFVTFLLALVTLFTWPIRWFIKTVIMGRRARNRRVKRVVIVGLDGQDPELTSRFMEEGLLPNFARLRDQGSFTQLGTTTPPITILPCESNAASCIHELLFCDSGISTIPPFPNEGSNSPLAVSRMTTGKSFAVK